MTIEAVTFDLWDTMIRDDSDEPKRAALGLRSKRDERRHLVWQALNDVAPIDKAAVARAYDAGLAGSVSVPERPPGSESAWSQYTIRLDDRDRVAAALEARGIPTAVYYPRPLHLQSAYRHFGAGPGSLPVSEALCARVLSLPMHPYLDDGAAARVSGLVVEASRRGPAGQRS